MYYSINRTEKGNLKPSVNNSRRERRERRVSQPHDTVASRHVDGDVSARMVARCVLDRREISSACYGKTVLRMRACVRACVRSRKGEREREREAGSSTSEGSPVVPQAKRAREAFSRARLGMRPLPRPASRRSHGGKSSFLSAVASLPRSRVPPIDRRPSRSLVGDRNDRTPYYVSSINREYRAGRTAIRGMPHPSHG